MTLRRRLVLGILGVLALLVVAVGTTEYVVLRNYLYNRAGQRLSDIASQGTAVVDHGPGGRDDHGRGGSPTDGGTVTYNDAPQLATRLQARDIATEVLDNSGTELAAARSGLAYGSDAATFSVPPGVTPPSDSGAGAGTSAAQPSSQSVVDSGGRHLLVLAQRLPGQNAPTIVLATDLSPEDSTLRTVLLVTLGGGAGAMLLAALLTIPLTRASLAPLRRVAATADHIAEGRLSERAALPHTRDEVGRLGQAFDRMVDRVEGTLGDLRVSVAEQGRLVDRLQERDGAMRRFVADASHELRTPLTAIRGQAQVLGRGGVADADTAEGLSYIRSEAERMTTLVNDLLLLSRADAGAPVATRERVDLGSLVEAERRRWDALAPGHEVRVDVQPVDVLGDRDALLRVVANLVRNAGLYSPPSTAIEVIVDRHDGSARLRVRDHGPGIPDTELERVFERFNRGDPARGRTTGGTGLGLSIVRAVAVEHGGTARAERAPDGGALLVVEIPVAPPRA